MPQGQTQRPTRHRVFNKFTIALAILGGYFLYLTYTYDVQTGLAASALTWSFFVLCTPVADAGILLDFPMRLLFGVRMVISEVAVWAIAIGLNLAAMHWFAGEYQTTAVTRLLLAVLTHPWPYWLVIVISAAGTFLSIRFGDELMDVLHHHERDIFHRHGQVYELLILAAAFAIALVAYYELIAQLGLDPSA